MNFRPGQGTAAAAGRSSTAAAGMRRSEAAAARPTLLPVEHAARRDSSNAPADRPHIRESPAPDAHCAIPLELRRRRRIAAPASDWRWAADTGPASACPPPRRADRPCIRAISCIASRPGPASGCVLVSTAGRWRLACASTAQRLLVAGARIAHRVRQPAHGLDVLREHFRPGIDAPSRHRAARPGNPASALRRPSPASRCLMARMQAA